MQTADHVKAAKKSHREVATYFQYVSDPEKYGMADFWTQAPVTRRIFLGQTVYKRFFGDCEDFAILCREKLEEKGFLSRLVLCRTEGDGGLHIFCLVGEVVMDVRFKWPVDLSFILNKGYTLISASGHTPGEPWKEILGVSHG